MKKLLLARPFAPFLITALFSTSVAIFLKGIFPHAIFDVSVYNTDYSISEAKIWFVFSGYLFFLTGIYYVISRTTLKARNWLVISHYIFIVLFLLFFAIFRLFTLNDVQKFISGMPLRSLISIYGILFLADALFFIVGILLLFINLISLKKDGAE